MSTFDQLAGESVAQNKIVKKRAVQHKGDRVWNTLSVVTLSVMAFVMGMRFVLLLSRSLSAQAQSFSEPPQRRPEPV